MNINQVKIYFYVRPSTVKGKRGCLNVRVTVNNKQIVCSVKSLGMYPDEFDVKTQNPKKKCDLFFECHNFMVGIRQEINKIHNEYEKKMHVFTKEDLERSVEKVYYRVKHGHSVEYKTLPVMYDEFLAEEEKGLGRLISKGTHLVRKRYKKVFMVYLADMNLLATPICNITERDVRAIQSRLIQTYAVGTVARMYPVLSMIFEFAKKQNEIIENPCDKIEMVKHSKTTDLLWLENEEVEKLINLKLTGQAKKYRDAFVFCCFTGLSIGDYMLLNPKKCDELVKKAESPKDILPGEIINTRSGDFLIGKRRKTGTLYRVPLLPEASKIVEEYGGLENMPYNLVKMSDMLNTFMNMAKIKKKIRFHTARKTMANYLINVKMVPPFHVKEMMGWKKIEESTPYTLVNMETLAFSLLNK